MALTSTLFTGLSGLDVNQTRLNVVGNNIANVNTVAFKSSRALFKPQFYVTDGAGSPPSADFGGENPSQWRGQSIQDPERGPRPSAVDDGPSEIPEDERNRPRKESANAHGDENGPGLSHRRAPS